MNEVKQFVVLKVWNHATTPTVVGHFDTEADAREFADLSHKTDLEYRFAVARTVYVTK